MDDSDQESSLQEEDAASSAAPHDREPNTPPQPEGMQPEADNDQQPSDDADKEAREGSEASESEDETSGKPAASKKKPHKKLSKRTIIVIAVIAAVLVICAIIAGVQQQRAEEERQQGIAAEKAAEAAREKKVKEHKEYVDNLNQAVYLMILGASESETSCSLTIKVWNAAVFDEWDETTSPYKASDFNDALAKLMQSKEYQDRAAQIETYSQSVSSTMGDLTNPPDGCKEAYETLKSMYRDYSSLASMATNPSGSLQTYSSSYRQTDDDLLEDYNLIKTQIPNSSTPSREGNSYDD